MIESTSHNESASRPASHAASRRVLVMEADVVTADLIANLLEDDGYEVEISTHGQYGLIVADAFDPHLIVLDIELPGLPGTEMKQVLRAAPQFAGRFLHTPILYLAGDDHILQQRFHSLPDTPMTNYLMKPVDATELRAKVRRSFIERERREKEQQQSDARQADLSSAA